MGKQIKHPQGFLNRLLRSQSGNVMAIVAAAIIPLAALIGGGLDMSRAYMVRARLQQACDAAALAGRRAMTTSSMTDANKAEAKKFFDFNFPQNTFQTESFVPTIQSKPSETTTVQVSAVTKMPTTVMRIFKYTEMPLEVTCESRFDIGNTDVMLVLDTTGSMAQSISDGAGGTTTRMAALQQAVKDFYDTLGAGSNNTGRIRYGFMPYSSTVNVGYQLPSSAMLGGTAGETAPYRTRRALYYYETSSTPSTCYRRYGLNNCYSTATAANNASTSSTLSASQCTAYGNNSGTNPSKNGNAPSNTTTTTYSYHSFNGSTNTPSGWNDRKCVRREDIVATTYATTYTAGLGTTFYYWEYGQFAVDVSGFISGNSVSNPTYNASSPNDANNTAVASTSTWLGCIEERSTDSTITASTSTASIPDTAYDLQIDTLPTNADTKWRPHWPQVMFNSSGRWLHDNREDNGGDWYRASSGGWNACPSQSRKLTSYADRTSTPTGQSSSFNTYVNGLIAVGGTYHDIGMIWGARFLSPTGIFSADNGNAPNGFNISRHIVFMTDGDMSAYDRVYGAYGYQKQDGRVAATSTDDTGLTAVHNRRLEMLCNAVKGKGITVWVIGFRNQSEGDITSQLQGCASSSNHWMMAYTAASLTEKFKDIAKNIGGLRLSQ
ncbi:TadE/TadG family type IV pilus assembly protein [Sphingobium sp. KCTC 72723]|uniref:TadE/TadG family type IV pilus assembly protein n=1 Tax=Sphingobium sp. KCTC 72723 TaxID=2733867 RepID=UPI00165E7D59|nr:TadE/TadG family type IV pilus assembly protein [Sphingobium sp. KCTC 72723]